MDAAARMRAFAASTTMPLVDFFAQQDGPHALGGIVSFRAQLAERLTASLVGLAPTAAYLGKSPGVYEFIRTTLSIRMHGAENAHDFKEGPGVEGQTIGQHISLIHEAIRDVKMQDVVVGLFT
ncbi:hypothetical protein DICSQDRAFT_173631 [Dichomitus squalens LYAD-421 SS1]|uniref:Uncharacterized protein n=1 Tax=Dichomitus squalens (strain LYAD-421) TaxID=732165 RepID=R7SNV4_DICSQ|nr:uncharacterized protein DICSQDRAFT_173631 [Dichomitus squalens LYAD-421 SS1]EJF57761.1 hypothetical protein DICSQDRAFT_173631 [Dichomitus squalens LYAD-421 SS1]